MTRETEIRKEAIEVTHFAQFGHSGRDMLVAHDAFILGAQWADEHPKEGLISIDKVDKYLKEHIILYARTTTLDQQKEWFNNFRKAMEE